jgi:hypothetical protein
MTMEPRRGWTIAAASALLLAGCVAPEKHQITIARTWPAAGIHRINVREVDGAINVVAGRPDEISLVAHIESRGFQPKKTENQGYFQSRIDGDTLVLGREHGSSVHISIPFFNSRELKVNYDLKVPPATELALRTVNGHITSIGVDGEWSATTVNGGIDVDIDGRNEVAAKSVNGYVRAKFRDEFQGAQLKTVNGSVRATLPPTASFACDLSQVNGDFEATFPLSIHSHPGNRRVSGEVNGGRYQLRITTVNGDIQVQTSGPLPPQTPAAADPDADDDADVDDDETIHVPPAAPAAPNAPDVTIHVPPPAPAKPQAPPASRKPPST